MSRIIVYKQSSCVDVDSVCIQNGFVVNKQDGVKRHNTLRQYFCTSPANSERLWEKDNRLYLFNGWVNTDRDITKWNSLELVDVTDMLIET